MTVAAPSHREHTTAQPDAVHSPARGLTPTVGTRRTAPGWALHVSRDCPQRSRHLSFVSRRGSPLLSRGSRAAPPSRQLRGWLRTARWPRSLLSSQAIHTRGFHPFTRRMVRYPFWSVRGAIKTGHLIRSGHPLNLVGMSDCHRRSPAQHTSRQASDAAECHVQSVLSSSVVRYVPKRRDPGGRIDGFPLRDYAGTRWPTLNHKGRMSRLAGVLGFTHRRVRALYQNEQSVRLRADEMQAIEALRQKRIEEANRYDFQALQERVARLEAALLASDPEFHQPQMAALREALDGGRGGNVARAAFDPDAD